MASSAKTCILLFLLTLLSSQQIFARESQFFNKVPRNSNNNVAAELEPNKQEPLNKPEQEPNFIPENESGGYGLYGHESGQLPPSTTSTNAEPYKTTTNIGYNSEVKESSFPNSKYLPKNYNTEAYVTEPEGYTPTTTTPENNNNYSPFSIPNSKYLPKNYNTESYVTEPEDNTFNPENNHYNNQQQGYIAGANENSYNGNNYNSFAQKDYTTRGGSNNYNYYNGVTSNGVQKQGMSDTRFLENGKYFHDINLEKPTPNNPYANTRSFGPRNEYNNRGFYGNNENSFEYNNAMEGYQNQEQFQNFQDEEDMP